MEKQTLIVNLFGGPGTGKSTLCADIFAKLKWKNINCEMALEFAKDKVWEESFKVLDNQIYIFGKQLHRIHRLNKKVDVVITDSPLLLSIVYDKSKSRAFKELVIEKHNSFNNVNIFLKRVKAYQSAGRMQDEDGAKDLDHTIHVMLMENAIPYSKFDASQDNVQDIVDLIITHLFPVEYINAVKNV